jgi:hypothetical protein
MAKVCESPWMRDGKFYEAPLAKGQVAALEKELKKDLLGSSRYELTGGPQLKENFLKGVKGLYTFHLRGYEDSVASEINLRGTDYLIQGVNFLYVDGSSPYLAFTLQNANRPNDKTTIVVDSLPLLEHRHDKSPAVAEAILVGRKLVDACSYAPAELAALLNNAI